MSLPFEEAASILETSKDKLARDSLKAYLKQKSRELRAELTTIYLKYQVASFQEFDDRIKKGELDEDMTFDDFVKADYLEEQLEKIQMVLSKLS
ncbi:hypothetical protein [Moorella sp. ACPs]|uniref:hypothetical protein n=1 Tax=Neomoorella carbonis TaxID=3062783 RepID=UPI00324423FE